MAGQTIPITRESKATIEVKSDGLGSIGPLLNHYHFGDALGLVGLVITAITLYQAHSAKSAAQSAARTAIRLRDQLESASQLSELATNLRAIRDVYHAENIAILDILKDRTVTIAAELSASMSKDTEIVELMSKIIEHLRDSGPISKDDTRRRNQLHRMAKTTISLADKVETLKSKRLKNGS